MAMVDLPQFASQSGAQNHAAVRASRAPAAAGAPPNAPTPATPPAVGLGRTDTVELSQAARLVEDFRASRNLTAPELMARLKDALSEARNATDAFAARLAAGRRPAAARMPTSINDAVHATVVDLMQADTTASKNPAIHEAANRRTTKPDGFWQRVVAKLFG